MSGYLYFPNNLNDDYMQTYTKSCKIFFQLMVVTVFKKKHEVIANPFILSIMFVTETVFVSE